MAMGNLGGGLGTQASPFEVWDVADFEALRGRPTSASSPVHVSIKADIDFSPRTNFNTIRFGNNTAGTNNWDFVHIDGEGHTLHNFRQNGIGAATSVGLFRFIVGSIKNITVQDCDLRGNVGATRAVLVQNFSVTGPIENVRVFGTMVDSNTMPANNRAGIATHVNSNIPGSTVVFSDCLVGIRATVSTQFSGFCSCPSGNFMFSNCISSCEITVAGTANNGHCTGFIGLNSAIVNDTGTYVFDACVSDCRFIAVNAAGSFPAVVSGYRTRASGATQTGPASTFTNCISRCSFDGAPNASGASDMASFAPVGMFKDSVNQCYSICTYKLRDSSADISGGEGVVIFDYENSGLPLSRFTDGAAMGLTTNQMQSEDFLTHDKGWVFSQGGWRIDPSRRIWNGYPFIHEFSTHPLRDGAEVSSLSGYLDIGMHPLKVTFFNLLNILDGDRLAIQMEGEGGAVALQEETILDVLDSGTDVSATVSRDAILSLPAGSYSCSAFILRGTERFLPYHFTYMLFESVAEIDNIMPSTVTKPVSEANNSVSFDYAIISDIREASAKDVTFRLGDYSRHVTNRKLMQLPGTIITNGVSTASVNLNVTAPIWVNSIAHFARVSLMPAGTSFTITYSINAIEQGTIGPFTGGPGIADRYYEMKLAVPVLLGAGSNSIRFTSSNNAIRLFLTSERPSFPEFTIPGTQLTERMQMEFSPVGQMQGTCVIDIDNHIPIGEIPIKAEGAVVVGGEPIPFGVVSGSKVTVEPGLIDLGNVTQSVSGGIAATRYIGTGVGNKIATSNITGAMGGDVVSVSLARGAESFYECEEKMADAFSSFSHTIPAHVFSSLPSVGDYVIALAIRRGDFIDSRLLPYTVIARPVLSAVSITPSLVDLPILPPRPLSTTWRIADGVGCTLKGHASIVNVLDEAETLVVSCGFEETADVPSFSFSVNFEDIANLKGGLYSVILSASVEHGTFGVFDAVSVNSKALTVAYPGVPGISRFSLSVPGRYVGAHTNVFATTRLFNVIAGRDRLRYKLTDSGVVLSSFTTEPLTAGTDAHVHMFPVQLFANLRPGIVAITVTSLRDGEIRQAETVPYETVQPPTLHFISVEPSELSYPIDPAVDLAAKMFVNGRGIESIRGRLELENTPYESFIDVCLLEGGD